MARNVALYPWFNLFQNLTFWQSVWFLFFQNELSAAAAIVLYALYDIAVTLVEVPSGYMSDRLGRRKTLILSAFTGVLGTVLIVWGSTFEVFVVAIVLLGGGRAFSSGTDSALLYESLAANGRGEEVEAQETRSWQYTLWGLAFSAVMGGVLASYAFEWAFVATAVSFVIALGIAWHFAEPPHHTPDPADQGLRGQLRHIRQALAQPVLVWLLLLAAVMYAFSHVPFVFGQPFIAEALAGQGWSAEAPIVSGSVSAAMMLVSVAASLCALWLRHRIGLPAILMLSFGIQIGLIVTLALTNSVFAIVVLFLRMVPDSWSYPFIVARIQPLLNDAGRATYLSVQSFAGRLLLAGSLLLAAGQTRSEAPMAYAELQMTLGFYALAGLACFAALLALVRWAHVEPVQH
jgi:MFS family permease